MFDFFCNLYLHFFKLENEQINDEERIKFFKGYLSACAEAIEDGVNLKGYFIWLFMDNFEWTLGYRQRFDIHYVDFETLERIPKASAIWFRKIYKVVVFSKK